MAEPPPGTVIVGASVAGLHAAEQLRAAGYGGAIDLIDAETRLPYDRQTETGRRGRSYFFVDWLSTWFCVSPRI